MVQRVQGRRQRCGKARRMREINQEHSPEMHRCGHATGLVVEGPDAHGPDECCKVGHEWDLNRDAQKQWLGKH